MARFVQRVRRPGSTNKRHGINEVSSVVATPMLEGTEISIDPLQELQMKGLKITCQDGVLEDEVVARLFRKMMGSTKQPEFNLVDSQEIIVLLATDRLLLIDSFTRGDVKYVIHRWSLVRPVGEPYWLKVGKRSIIASGIFEHLQALDICQVLFKNVGYVMQIKENVVNPTKIHHELEDCDLTKVPLLAPLWDIEDCFNVYFSSMVEYASDMTVEQL